MNDHPKIPEGQPTWARVRHGGGVSLPRVNPEKGGPAEISVWVPIQLERVNRSTEPGGPVVWQVPARVWSPGDEVEIGPLPPNTLVEYEIPRQRDEYLVEV